MSWITNNEIALLTAFRGKKENIVNSDRVKNDGKQVGDIYTHKENRERNRELGAALLRLGYGITKISGVYVENFGQPNSRLSNEETFLVVNKNNDPDFYNNIFKLSEYYNQDCFCYKAKEDNVGYNIGTNGADYPGYDNKDRNGKFVVGVKNEFMSRLRNKGFAFTDNNPETLEPFETSHQDRKAERTAEKMEKSLNEEFDHFGKYSTLSKQSISNIGDNVVKTIKENSPLTEIAINKKKQMKQSAINSINGVQDWVKTFLILTGQNPMGQIGTNKDNRNANTTLVKYLKQGNFAWQPVKGKYGTTEDSKIIFNISITESKRLALLFNQESFIYGRKEDDVTHFDLYVINNDGNDYIKTETQDKYNDMNGQEDYYTAIDKDHKFSIPFEYFNEACQNYNKIITEIYNKSDNYQSNYDRSLNESLKDDMTGKHYYLHRTLLYGGLF